MVAPLYFPHPASLGHLTGLDPEAPARITAIEQELDRHAVMGYERRAAPEATNDGLCAIRADAYVERVRSMPSAAVAAAARHRSRREDRRSDRREDRRSDRREDRRVATGVSGREAGEDISGPFDEAEHVNDPRCRGVAAGIASRDDDSDESGGRGGEDRHGGSPRRRGERQGDDEDGDRGGSYGHGGGGGGENSGLGRGGGEDD